MSCGQGYREVKSQKEQLGTIGERALLLGHTQHLFSDCSVWKLDCRRSGRELRCQSGNRYESREELSGTGD